MNAINVAVVGATGAVGREMQSILATRNFPIKNLHLVASERSAGKSVKWRDQNVVIENLTDFDFTKVDLALFSAGGSISREYAPNAASQGCVVVDNTSEFRYEDDIPLVVPEVNATAIEGYRTRNIIANPNCSTIQMLVALKPIYDAVGIERINVSTYQAVSGSGAAAISELSSQVEAWKNGQPMNAEVYSQPIAFNALPHIDSFQDNGYTREEMKMVWETQKIFADENIMVNPTAVRIPVFNGHSEALHIETKQPLSAQEAKVLLSRANGVELLDDPQRSVYATAAVHADGADKVFVSRVRDDISHPRGLNLWVVADNLRKGAALNSVQIAEYWLKNHHK